MQIREVAVRKRKADQEADPPLFWGLTPNQVVAYNLFQARKERRWTQAQAAEALEPHLGVRWTVAQVSAAERSVDGARIRQFTADDIVAFAQAFGLPIGYFFFPPRSHAKWSRIEPGTTTAQASRTMSVMIDLIFGDPLEGAPRMAQRLNDYVGTVDQHLLTEAQTRIFNVAKQRVLAVVRRAVGSLDNWQRSLRDIADGLGTLKADTVELLVRSLPDITEEDLAFEAAELETSQAAGLELGLEGATHPSPERSR
jgi:transcriptional regulator with XRE-family HTH domain